MKITDLLEEPLPTPGTAPATPAPGSTAQGATLDPNSQMVAKDPAAQQKQMQLQIAQHQKEVQDKKKEMTDQIADLTKQITDIRKQMAELK
jgi:septal ring factor EnvC (AmiA/AmiB activator)